MTSFARRFTGLLVFVLFCGSAWAQEKSKAEKPTHADVKYGPAERNVLDFYQAKSESAAGGTPLVIYIHGGGFVGGNKNIAPGQVKAFHDAGMSVASIHYRFVDGKTVIFPAAAP